MPTETADAAADILIDFWTGPQTFEWSKRDLCARLARMVDSGGRLASIVRQDPDRSAERVGAVIRAAMSRQPEVTGLVRRLVPGFGPVPEDRVWEEEIARPVTGGAILLASADPSEMSRLKLGREAREIREALDLSRGRERWKLHPWAATRLRDLTRALLEVKPRIVHFAGHGSPEEGLCLEDEAGRMQRIPPDALANLFSVIGRKVECVVLNACYSESQARAMSTHVPFVVGAPAMIVDHAAVAYSVGFYQMVGDGATFPESHRVACVHMQGAGTAGAPLPVLMTGGQDRPCDASAAEGVPA